MRHPFSLISRFFLLALLVLSPLSSASALDARPITAADLAELGGSDFNAGVGDLLLRNDKVWAVVLAIGATPDFNVPFTAEVLPSAGVLIDAGTVGDRNDELNEIHQLLNLSPDSLVLYGALVNAGVAGDTASITVAGIALFPSVSTPSSPTIFVTTTYSVTEGNAWIDIESTVTNGNGFPLPIFQITDADITVSRSRIPFQPFPFRGSKNPPLDLSDPLAAFGAFPFVSTPGVLGPEDGSINDDGSAKQNVSYSFFPPSVNEPLIGFASPAVVAVGNSFDLAALAAGNPPLLGPGASLSVERRFVISDRNDVESTLDIGLPGIGLGTRAELTGRIVDGDGNPVPDAHVFFDNTFPGANPALAGFVTVLDENRDGSADGVIPVAPGDPVPFTHVITGADGRFTVRLPALSDPFTAPSVYVGEIRASERDYATLTPFSVDLAALGGVTDLGDLLVSDTGELEFRISRKPGHVAATIPGQLRIFGTHGTPDPDLGSQYSSARSYSGLVPGGGADPVTGSNSGDLSEAVAGLPALNFAASANGQGTISLRPGTYRAVATHGLEWGVDEKEFTIQAGQTTKVDFRLRRALVTSGFVSADFHVHSARSFDASAPPVDRITAYAAKGVDVVVSTDHDQITDYTSVIEGLGLQREIASIVGNETTGTIPVPASAVPGGIDAFPQGIGHWNAWPLEFIPGARRGGSPADELLPAGAVVDRLRGMDSLKLLGATPDTASVGQWLAAAQAGRPGTPGAGLPVDDEVVMLNHPRAGFAGTVVIGLFNALGTVGYDPNLPITAFPNNLLNLPSLYNKAVVGPAGTDTTVLSFDALEVQNGPGISGYQRVREDWFSLLKQGIHRTGTAVADSHRVVLENAGFPRSYVAASRAHPFDEDEMTAAIKSMKVIGSSGPFIRFRLFDFANLTFRGLGETAAGFGDFGLAWITVDAAPWIPVEEVRIFKNGVLVETLPVDAARVLGTRRRFARFVVIEGVTEDSFVTVEAGVSVDANGDPLSTALIADVQAIEPDLEPLGWTNPIFVDRSGDGYVPPGL